MEVQNDELPVADEDVRKAKQGKVTGVIIPPPDIRAVVDKTAQFVARNGKTFEQKILSSGEGKTAKFNFMKQFDPYHAYYEQKIREFEEGKKSDAAAEPSSTAAGAASEETKQAEVAAAPVAVQSTIATAKASVTTPIARFAMNKLTTAPHPFEFTVEHPSGLSGVDVDIIKLTAQYTVANGKEFLLGLAVREQRNPQFDFLKPTHMLFSYFTTLVDAYAKVLQPSSEQLERMKAKKDRMKALEMAVHRWEWNRSEEERKKKETVHVDEERSAFQSIDWFDFTVVETIDFAENELYEVPSAPKAMAVVREEDEDMDEDMDEDDDHRETTQRMEMPAPPQAPINAYTNNIPQNITSSSSGTTGLRQETSGSHEDAYKYSGGMEMDTEMDLNVVSDYAPRMANSGVVSGPLTMVDPISGKVIPVDEMSEHMRVQLMDPRWRIEQKRFQDKQRETGYAEGGSIADSLKQFAKKRGDIFGGRDASGQGGEEKKAAESVQWDGHMASIPQMQQLKNEMAARAPQVAVTAASVLPAIGPTIPGLGPQAPRIVTLPPPMTLPVPTPPPAPLMSMPAMPMSLPLPMPAPMPMPMSMPAPVLIALPSYPVAPLPMQPPYMPYPVAPSAPVPAPVPVPAQYEAPPPMPAAPGPHTEPEREMPAGKKPRTDMPAPPAKTVFIPAAQFAAQHPGLVTVHTAAPVDSTVPAWGLQGQTVDVSVLVTSTIKHFKEALSALLGGMPAAKQQLKAVTGGAFFKDTQTLADLNLGSGASIDLTVKTRGGAKK